MRDGGMNRLSACTIVAGMFPGAVGWDILRSTNGGNGDPECPITEGPTS